MTNSDSVCFDLNVSPEKYLQYYKGEAQHVLTRTTDGRTIQFPASLLRTHVSSNGIHGKFKLTFDKYGCCQKLEKKE